MFTRRTLLYLSIILVCTFGSTSCGPTGSELLRSAQQCDLYTPAYCVEEWAAWNKHEDYLLLKEEWAQRFQCQKGYVYYCGDTYCRSPRPIKRNPRPLDLAHSGCVTTEDLERILGPMLKGYY